MSKKDKKEKKEVLGLHNLKSPVGSRKKRKLLGRGSSSGHGKTSTRGSKGQTSRAGRHFYLGFEGGQTPLIRRIPKRGFNSRSRREFQIVNLKDLEGLKSANITLAFLEEKGLIKSKNKLVKILGEGEVKNALTVCAHSFSKQAAQKIAQAGGKAELVNA
ncbi:50S ribosomal protein L15 [bacterium]|nr:MAG: 50S ribosomal protein L15 [bacterium]